MIFTSSRSIVFNHTIEEIDGLSHVGGDPSGMRFRCGSIVAIHSWGPVPFTSMEFMFESCGEVTILCDESPIFAHGCSLRGMFQMCPAFNQGLNWDTSKVIDMGCMFPDCTSLNRILRWDTSKVTDMSHMFHDCTGFDKEFDWDTSKVTDMSHMYAGCTPVG